METRVALACVPALALAACSSFYPVRVTRLGDAGGPPQSVSHVEVWRDVPARPFVEIARLSTESANYDSPGHAVERLRRVAAEHGADAIIVQDRGHRSSGIAPNVLPLERDFGFSSTDAPPREPGSAHSVAAYATAIAIRWREPAEDRAVLGPAMSGQTIAGEEGAPSRPADAPFFVPPEK